MARKVLVIVLVVVALGVLPLAVSDCGDRGVAQASAVDAAQPRLLDIGDFSLLKGRPTRVMLHATTSHPLRIIILAERPLDSITLLRVAAADGSQVAHVAVTLRGSPHTSGGQTAYGLTAGPIETGYYRLDLVGRGRIGSLAVQDR